MKLQVDLLDREAFAPYGDVIEIPAESKPMTINGGTSQRFHDLARLDPGEKGRLTLSIFRAQPSHGNLLISMLERHPKGSQAFIPLQPRPFLIVVAPRGEAVTPGEIRAFMTQEQQGVNFAAGIWHHPLLALYAESDFLVIDRDDPMENYEELHLEKQLVIPETAYNQQKYITY